MTSLLELIFRAVTTSMHDGSKLSKELVLLIYSSQPAYMICHSASSVLCKDMDTVMKLLHRNTPDLIVLVLVVHKMAYIQQQY